MDSIKLNEEYKELKIVNNDFFSDIVKFFLKF